MSPEFITVDRILKNAQIDRLPLHDCLATSDGVAQATLESLPIREEFNFGAV